MKNGIYSDELTAIGDVSIGKNTSVEERFKDMNTVKKIRNKRTIFHISIFLFVIVATLALFVTLGILSNKFEPLEFIDTSDVSATVEPMKWPETAWEPYTIIKINMQSSETNNILVYENKDRIKCVRCDCEVLYFNTDLVKTLNGYSSFNSVVFVPYESREAFYPGSTVLINLISVFDSSRYYLPHLDDQNRPEFIRFFNERIIIDNELDYESFVLLKEVNKVIDLSNNDSSTFEWMLKLPPQKIESGMYIEDVCDFFTFLMPAAKEYYKSISTIVEID